MQTCLFPWFFITATFSQGTIKIRVLKGDYFDKWKALGLFSSTFNHRTARTATDGWTGNTCPLATNLPWTHIHQGSQNHSYQVLWEQLKTEPHQRRWECIMKVKCPRYDTYLKWLIMSSFKGLCRLVSLIWGRKKNREKIVSLVGASETISAHLKARNTFLPKSSHQSFEHCVLWPELLFYLCACIKWKGDLAAAII